MTKLRIWPIRWRRALALPLTVLCLSIQPGNSALAMGDALEMPAQPSERAQQSLLLDITPAGSRLVAVGELGHILYSDDHGVSWSQAEVPVRVTLTSVHFPTPESGWAVGHDGVILASNDGGRSWVKQLDGREANQITRDHAEAMLAQLEANLAQAAPEQQAVLQTKLDDLAFLVDDVVSFVEEGPARPFLKVWFKSASEGWALGAFGLILHTEDSGQTWQSHFGRLDNPDGFHYYAMTTVGDTLMIAGEAGSFYRSMDQGATWESLPMPYEGSMFGLLSDGQALVAYGLRGHLFRSSDQGDSWQAVDSGTESLLAAGTLAADGRWFLVGSDGVVLTSKNSGLSFESHIDSQRRPYSGVIAGKDGDLLTVGAGGFHRPLTSSAAKE